MPRPARFGESALPKVLARAGHLPAVHPRSGEALQPGRIVVAPPDHHLLVRDSKVRLSRAVHRRLVRLATERGEGDPREHVRTAEAAEERGRRIEELATEDPAPA